MLKAEQSFVQAAQMVSRGMPTIHPHTTNTEEPNGSVSSPLISSGGCAWMKWVFKKDRDLRRLLVVVDQVALLLQCAGRRLSHGPLQKAG
jgi:hypothetical protein